MSIKSIFSTAFPFISAAASLGGPMGTMAANAVGKALGIDKLGSSGDAIADAIATATSKDPDAMLKLKQAEEQFQLQLTQMGFDSLEKLEKIASDDRANARAREVAVKDKTPMILAFTIISAALIGEGCFSYALINGMTLTAEAAVIIGRILGTIDTSVAAVLLYYYGSSASSSEKNAIIAKAMPNGQ